MARHTNSNRATRYEADSLSLTGAVAMGTSVMIYLLVSPAVGANLSGDEIVSARDYAVAEAARPAFGTSGLLFTVVFAIVATASGVVASVFAVSRMLAMAMAFDILVLIALLITKGKSDVFIICSALPGIALVDSLCCHRGLVDRLDLQ